MTVSVAILSKYETFQFSAQYSRSTSSASSIDPSTYLFLYSLTDELASIFEQQNQAEAIKYNIANDFTQTFHAYQTFSGHILIISVSNDTTYSEDALRKCFEMIHKILCFEMQNPFYRNGGSIESDGVLKDIGAAVFSM